LGTQLNVNEGRRLISIAERELGTNNEQIIKVNSMIQEIRNNNKYQSTNNTNNALLAYLLLQALRPPPQTNIVIQQNNYLF